MSYSSKPVRHIKKSYMKFAMFDIFLSTVYQTLINRDEQLGVQLLRQLLYISQKQHDISKLTWSFL